MSISYFNWYFYKYLNLQIIGKSVFFFISRDIWLTAKKRVSYTGKNEPKQKVNKLNYGFKKMKKVQ